MQENGIGVFKCPFCKCHKDVSKLKSPFPSIEELGCYTCENKTCHYCYGEQDYHRHIEECHGVHDPKHIKIDGVDHIVNGI